MERPAAPQNLFSASKAGNKMRSRSGSYRRSYSVAILPKIFRFFARYSRDDLVVHASGNGFRTFTSAGSVFSDRSFSTSRSQVKIQSEASLSASNGTDTPSRRRDETKVTGLPRLSHAKQLKCPLPIRIPNDGLWSVPPLWKNLANRQE